MGFWEWFVITWFIGFAGNAFYCILSEDEHTDVSGTLSIIIIVFLPVVNFLLFLNRFVRDFCVVIWSIGWMIREGCNGVFKKTKKEIWNYMKW